MATVALPVENKVRELDGKLWLGLNLIDHGYKVTIGPSWEIKYVLDEIDPDTYLTKDPGDGNIEFFKNLRNGGVNVCGLAPEVGVNSSVDTFMKNRQNMLNYIDAYFAWGEVTADSIRTYYEDSIYKDRIVVTGNPRFDLVTRELRSIYESTSQDILNKYGEYVLINTNFTLANPITREKTYTKIRDVHPDRDPHQESIGELQVYYSFLELIFTATSRRGSFNVSTHLCAIR
jgi:surface carbohydrate biosynthesis protein